MCYLETSNKITVFAIHSINITSTKRKLVLDYMNSKFSAPKCINNFFQYDIGTSNQFALRSLFVFIIQHAFSAIHLSFVEILSRYGPARFHRRNVGIPNGTSSYLPIYYYVKKIKTTITGFCLIRSQLVFIFLKIIASLGKNTNCSFVFKSIINAQCIYLRKLIAIIKTNRKL